MAENKKSEPGIPQTLYFSLYGVKTLDDAIRRDTGREIGPWKRKRGRAGKLPPRTLLVLGDQSAYWGREAGD